MILAVFLGCIVLSFIGGSSQFTVKVWLIRLGGFDANGRDQRHGIGIAPLPRTVSL